MKYFSSQKENQIEDLNEELSCLSNVSCCFLKNVYKTFSQ